MERYLENFIEGYVKNVESDEPPTAEEILRGVNWEDYCSFDGNNSVRIDDERKQKFIEHYKLRLLYSTGYSDRVTEYYVAANCVIVEIFMGYVRVFNTSTISTMQRIDAVLKAPICRIDYKHLASVLFRRRVIPSNRLDYEEIRELIKDLPETAITESFKEFVEEQYQHLVAECSEVTKVGVGTILKYVGGAACGIIDNTFVKVVGVKETILEIENMYGTRLVVSLEDLNRNFTTIQEDMKEIENVTTSVFWPLLDSDLMEGLRKQKWVDRKMKLVNYCVNAPVLRATVVGDGITFSVNLYSGKFELSTVERNNMFDKKTAGTIFDFPLVLNEYNFSGSEELRKSLEGRAKEYKEVSEKVLGDLGRFFEKYDELANLYKVLRERVNEVISLV